MGDLIKFGKLYASAAIAAKVALVGAVVLPLAAMVMSGGGELVIKWSVGS